MTESASLAPSRFLEDVSQALLRRAKTLLESATLVEDVLALAPLDCYFVVKELGAEDALPILKHATPEQLQTIVDLDCWQHDELMPQDLDAWLASFAHEGKEALARAFKSLDAEVQILFLAASLQIHLPSDGEPPEPLEDVPRMHTTDTFFVLDGVGIEGHTLNPFTLVEALYLDDHEEAYRLLMAAKWEHPSILEEMALGFRNGRTEDLGFPQHGDALKIFAPPQPLTPLATPYAPPVATLPALYAQPLLEGSLFTRTLAAVANPERLAALESDLVYLVNTAVVAYGEAPGDLTHVQQIATRVRDTVSLGLEVLLSQEAHVDDPESPAAITRGVELLDRAPVRHLFRLGHHQVVELAKSAHPLLTDPVFSAWLRAPMTERDDYSQDRLDREFIQALTAPRPLYGGYDKMHPERRKAFGSRTELKLAEARLDTIAERQT